MESKRLQALQDAGVDTQDALARFMGNAALYERFLLKFPNDPNFGQVGPALEQGDLDRALTAAHTLKGVAGNLGMTALFQACTQLVDLLRAGQPDAARAAYPALASAYQSVIQALIGEDGR